MKWFFDTNVLVAALLPDHPHHARSFPLFAAATRKHAACAAHSLAEAYSTFTRYPGKERMSAEAASLMIQGIEQRFTLVWLDGDEYSAAIRRMAQLGIVGGAVYDGLVAACALKSGAEHLYTWNVRHFDLLGTEIKKLVTMPPAV
ncbi:MAG: PIN domain-containing protein [Candidatus Sulfotelmatobacter sp.]